jgi:hypothetical protein
MDDFDLIGRKVVVGDSNEIGEIRTIRRLGFVQKRKIAEDQLAGSGTNALEDQGRFATRIVIEGYFVGKDAKQSLMTLRSKYKTGNPIRFSTDIAFVAHIQNVLVEELYIVNTYHFPNRHFYKMYLVEYKELVLPQDRQLESPTDQNESALEDVKEEIKKVKEDIKEDVKEEIKKVKEDIKEDVKEEIKKVKEDVTSKESML